MFRNISLKPSISRLFRKIFIGAKTNTESTTAATNSLSITGGNNYLIVFTLGYF